MINLLPTETKSNLRAARTNLLLFRYNIFFIAAIIFMLGSILFSYLVIANLKNSAEATILENRSKVSSYQPVEAKAQEFSSNLSSAKTILDNDITYTKVLLEISKVLPHGIVLNSLNLDSAEFGKPTVLSAKAKDYPTVLAFKNDLSKSNLFSDVNIQTISSGNPNSSYPLDVSLSVIIKKDAAR